MGKSDKEKQKTKEGAEKARKMKRIEIFCSQAIEEDFIKGFTENKIKCYTEFPEVRGTGYSTPKLGSDIWPQLNCMFILFCTKSDAAIVKEIVTSIREKYKDEGIACYVGKAKEW